MPDIITGTAQSRTATNVIFDFKVNFIFSLFQIEIEPNPFIYNLQAPIATKKAAAKQ